MKKRITVTLLVLAFCVGMFAGGVAFGEEPFSIKVLINGRELKSDPAPILVNGRIFVPLRAVSDYMGADVGWDTIGKTAYIASPKDALTGIEIIGPADFQVMIKKSLELLKDKAPEEYVFVGKYIRRIIYDSKLTRTYIDPQSMTVYIEHDYYEVNEYWWAPSLVHEAVHGQQTYNIKQQTVAERETEAGTRHLEVLKKIGAPKSYIEHMESGLKTGWW